MKMSYKNNQSGLSLIELMIAMVLGLILLAATIQIFLSTKQSYRLSEAHAILQDNARVALEIMSRDIRSAGYTGCKAIENVKVHIIANDPVPSAMDEHTIVTGSNSETATSWSPALDGALGTVVAGTDVITLQKAATCGANLVGNLTSSSASIKVYSPNTCSIDADDVLMISDCEVAHVFKATTESKDNKNNQQTITHASNANQATHFCTSYPSLPHDGACKGGDAKLYGHDAELYTFSAVTYFIRLGTNGAPSLWRYDHTKATNSTNPAELIEGIEDMQITYGLDDDGDNLVDRTENAKTINDASDWDKVISAHISLLIQTLDNNLTTDGQVYTYNGDSRTGEDGRLRRVFNSTIVMRNRVQ